MSIPRVWLVTGSSSGFGLAICKRALAEGDNVVATLRTPSALDALAAQYPENLLVAQVDVTRADEVAAAFRAAKARFGRVDVVFNNAGVSIAGEVESVPEEDARRVMDVNFWGAVHVSKEAVRFFREENPAGAGGLLLNVSSDGAHTSFPGVTYYQASKHALEGLTGALAWEVDPKWNIRVCLLTPGAFRTDLGAKQQFAPVHPAYTDVPVIKQVRHIVKAMWEPNGPMPMGSADKAAARIFEISKLEKLPLRVFLGADGIKRVQEYHQQVAADIQASEKWQDGLMEDAAT
ncbi:SDR family oxidoreductase [Phanerochaete sordida]|uniref:SDR family oxidoreductase n=1 Tax=Phanerochaete sordida TaxID=48140 RepID=A0A9P3LDV9_9APHY|nr:SDR family oxidoreductase [Phanerochaete sordida]